jgi:hypothetical protein
MNWVLPVGLVAQALKVSAATDESSIFFNTLDTYKANKTAAF